MKTRFLLVAAAAVILSACAGPVSESNPLLVKAQAAVAAASQEPSVAEYAPISLKKARDALDKAEDANTYDRTSHWAYIALRRAQIAQAKAAEGVASHTVAQAQEKRQQIMEIARRQELHVSKQKLESQDELIKALKEQLAELHPRKTDEGIVLTLGSVLFAFDSAELRPGAATTLNHLAKFLNQHPQEQVKIIGYTDSIGSFEYNMKLSRQRARSVKSALVQRGVPATRMVTLGRGETHPIATNATEAGRQRNRRVEFIILTDQGNRGGDAAVGNR
ncbi:MAG: OmpA family protein [Gammaproteobacteria bacterium]|nr:OmpA family protein [Gammaproteobacteria bacterium]